MGCQVTSEIKRWLRNQRSWSAVITCRSGSDFHVDANRRYGQGLNATSMWQVRDKADN